MIQLIYSKMPKIPTAGMTWTVSREKHPDLVLRIKRQTGYYLEIQQPKVDFEPIYNRFIQPKKEVKVDDLHRETKETRREIGALKQNLCGLQKTQSLESTSYQINEESPSDNEVHQTDKPRTDAIQEPSRDLFLEAITRSNLHKWHSKVRIVISKDFEFKVIALIDSGADLNCIQEGIIPSKYFKKSKEQLTSASGGKMQIEFKLPT